MVFRAVSAGTTGLLVLLAEAGASTHAAGVLIGRPSAAGLALAAFASVFVWTSGLRGLGGFLLPAGAVLLAVLFPKAGPSWLLFSGRPLLVFAFAALTLALIASRVRPWKEFLLPVFFVLYAGVAYQAQSRVGPDGDEPQYLMVTESLIHDHDLALDQDFREQRYAAFFSRPLEPHFRIRGPEGQIYSLHAVGLSILILPAYWLLGHPGASFFMALLAALLVREVRRLVRELSGDEILAEGTAWLVGLSPPVIHFAGLIFTEIPAALLLCVGLRTAVFGGTSRAGMVAALCAAGLPWLNVRYAILSVAIAFALACRQPLRRLVPGASILIGSALAIGWYHFELWGFFDPRRVYGRNREFSLGILPEGLPGLFFDQEFGLFVYAPIFVLSVSGLFQLFRNHRVLAVAGLIATLGVIATASVWPMWRGGFNPPARFLVPLVSVLAAPLALSLRRGLGPATALLAGWGLWCGLGGVANIETVHRDRDGVAPFFRTQSGAREWTAVLPSFVLSEDRPTRVLAWPWAVLLGLPLLLGATRSLFPSPRLRNRDTLLASIAFMSAAILADRLSPRVRSPERDATRLLGSPALLLPSFRFEASSTAAWLLEFFYEPHRFPTGHGFAAAVPLRAGQYELILATHDRLNVSDPPYVEARDRKTTAATRTLMVAARDGLHAAIELRQAGTFDLALVGGEPLAFVGAELRRVY